MDIKTVKKYQILKMVSILFVGSQLQACATTKNLPLEQVKKDQEITRQIQLNINNEKHADLDHVDVLVYNGDVSLSGLIYVDEDRFIAIRDAKKVQGVKSVSDQMQLDVNGF